MAFRSLRPRGLAAFVAVVAVVAALPAGRAFSDERNDPASYREFDVGDGKVTFDVTEAPFGQVVAERIQPRTRVNLIVAPEALDERVTLRVVDLHWVQALDAMVERINGVMLRKGLNLLKVERPTPLDMTFEGEDIQKVIRTIADFAGANVTISPLVKGTITVKLKNAPWRAALQDVVQTAGPYSLVEGEYGMLRVVPTNELALVSGTYVFRYMRPPPPYKGVVKTGASTTTTTGGTTGGGTGGSASVGADIVQSNVFIPGDDPAKAEEIFPIIAALRSIVEKEGGDVHYIATTNAILYTGTAPKAQRIRDLCEQLDVEPAQIFVDMNFIATSNQNALDFGLHSDTGLSVGLTGAGITHRLPFAASGGGWADVISGTNFPAPSSASFTYGTLSFDQTNLLFQFLRKDQCSKIVQAPKILALDNQEATIFVGESIRYARSTAASNQNGGLTFSVEEDENSPVNVGFQLLVIPHVIPGQDKIMMTVIPQQRSLNGTTSPIPGFDRFTVSGQTIDLPRVASSTLVTHMLLRNQETAVIGGLLEDREVEGQDGLPILSEIPLLGVLFRGTTKQKIRHNLMITITPRILRGSDAASATVADELCGRQEKLTREFESLPGGTTPAGGAPPPPAPVPPPAPAPPPVPVAPTK